MYDNLNGGMKTVLLILVIITTLVVYRCHTPSPVTANPDKATTNSGTAGSAKMSDEVAGKPGTAGVKADTTKIGRRVVIDSTRKRKDSL